jgi:hypothetical protein
MTNNTDKEPELNAKGYPKFFDKVLEYTGVTYEDIERDKKAEFDEFALWCDEHNKRMREHKQ